MFNSIEQPSLELMSLLEGVGGREYMQLDVNDRVAFEGNRLVFE